jgi:hypothetical protein
MNFSSPAADTRKKQSKRDEVSGWFCLPTHVESRSLWTAVLVLSEGVRYLCEVEV